MVYLNSTKSACRCQTCYKRFAAISPHYRMAPASLDWIKFSSWSMVWQEGPTLWESSWLGRGRYIGWSGGLAHVWCAQSSWTLLGWDPNKECSKGCQVPPGCHWLRGSGASERFGWIIWGRQGPVTSCCVQRWNSAQYTRPAFRSSLRVVLS